MKVRAHTYVNTGDSAVFYYKYLFSSFDVLPTVERRRRDKINNWIVQLSKAIPDCNIDYTKTGQVSACVSYRVMVDILANQ